jgi:acylphosphatase
MSAKRLRIAGRVQAVGYRHWLMTAASQLGLAGWVRNCADGSVEAVLAGDAAAVEELVRACRRGPRAARVDSIDEELVEPPEMPGFHILPDA